MEKEKILIIEDDEDTKLYLKYFIGKKFYVYLYNSSDFYYKFNESVNYDLIILDLSIKNKIEGEQVIKKIKSSENLRKISLICISAQTSLEEKENVIALGADEFMLKPVANEKLMEAILTHLYKAAKANHK